MVLPPSLKARTDDDELRLARERRAADLRRQLAVVRALADEVQRYLVRTDSDEIRAQLEHELARLHEASVPAV
jgi:hypothetical protein